MDEGYLEISGFRVGKFYNWWDKNLSGEADNLKTASLFNSVAYTADLAPYTLGIAIDELEGTVSADNNNVGVSAVVSGNMGASKFALVAGYDQDLEEGAIRGILEMGAGPGMIGLAAVWASGVNSYYGHSEWTVAAEYAFQASDKLKIIPGVQYFGNIPVSGAPDSAWSDDGTWQAGVMVEYKILPDLAVTFATNYYDRNEDVVGFLRLQRNF